MKDQIPYKKIKRNNVTRMVMIIVITMLISIVKIIIIRNGLNG